MGIKLIIEVLNHAPADLTPAERLVLVVLAEDANERTRLCWPGPGPLMRRTGLQWDSIRRVFQRLAKRGLEVRVAIGKGDDGRLLFAHEKARTTYRVPYFPPPDGCACRLCRDAEEEGPQSRLSEGTTVPSLAERGDDSPASEAQEEGPQSRHSPRGGTLVPQRGDDSPALPLNIPSSPSPSEKGGVGGNTRNRGNTADEHPRFREFWAAYPPHGARTRADRVAAVKAFNEAVKRADPQVIIDGAKRYAAERRGREPRYTKRADNWLREGRWDYEPDSTSTGQVNGHEANGSGPSGLPPDSHRYLEDDVFA